MSRKAKEETILFKRAINFGFFSNKEEEVKTFSKEEEKSMLSKISSALGGKLNPYLREESVEERIQKENMKSVEFHMKKVKKYMELKQKGSASVRASIDKLIDAELKIVSALTK